MPISKESVREYVSGLCLKRRKEIQTAIDALYDDSLRPIVRDRVIALTGRVDQFAYYIHEQLDKEENRKGILALFVTEKYYLSNYLSEATRLSNIRADLMRNVWGGITKFVESPSQGAFDFGSAEINDMVTRLQKDEIMRSLIRDRAAVDTLSAELKKNSELPGSGKQAYNRMVALGVDMSGYKEPEANLPAVQKLSVDVCVLSGNC